MKTLIKILLIVSLITIGLSGCQTSRVKVVTEKNGVILWSENCVRCHYAPSPTDYSDKQWDVIGNHMQIRALLTDNEKDKIIDFLKQAN